MIQKTTTSGLAICIRPETTEEYRKVDELIEQAFAASHGADIGRFMMEHLSAERKKDTFIPELSLVALSENGTIIGQVTLHKTDIITDFGRVTQLTLSQSAVLPAYRMRGIMRELVMYVLSKAKEMGYAAVFLGGNPAIYARFGFEPSAKYGIFHENRVKWGDKGFLVCKLVPDALDGITGTTYYYGG
ncbi:MAG: N-acetyltransferase [Oscillospiraceae bacterium]